MKSKFFPLLLASILLIACKETPIVDYQIIPQPNSIIYTNGVNTLTNNVKVHFTPEVAQEATLLQEYLNSDFGITAQTAESEKSADIVLELNNQYNPKGEDGYTLDIDKKKITLTSNTQAGVLNAVQSLRQIVREENGKFVVQAGTIQDHPAFSWRAFMLDEARYFKGMEVVKDLLDEMALLKMNIFHWHLTDDQGWRIEIKKYPKLTKIGAYRDSTEINHFHSEVFDGVPHGGFYTQEEIKEIEIGRAHV